MVLGLLLMAVVGYEDNPLPLLPPDFKAVDPETESRAAIAFLEKLEEDDRYYTRFISLYSIPKQERPEFEKKLMRLWWRQLTLNSNRRNLPAIVPGSDTLWWFDLRSFNWNDASWRAVALRDKGFREPWVLHPTAQRLRNLVAENQPENFHVIAIVDAFGLYRRTYQTFETPDYYDLLFSDQRFPLLEGETEEREIVRYWKGGIDEYGKDCPSGWYRYLKSFPKRGFKDFPKNYDEWLSPFLGNLSSEEYTKAVTRLKSRRGAVIKGMEDTKGPSKSFVAKNNREVWMEQLLGTFGGVFSQTFDVKKTAGKRDLEENAFTDQHRDTKRMFRDGGELLVTLPAGDGQASLVVNAKGERVEFVPPDIAIHTRDARDRTVRNGPMVCFNCHADAYGWIPLLNTIEDTTPDETDVRFQKLVNGNWVKDREAAEDYDSFFIGWQDAVKPAREVMKNNWLQATGTKKNQFKDGMTGIEFGKKALDWKWKYDDPLDMKQMCLETGMPEPFLRIAALRLPQRRQVDVVKRAEVPRPAWDEDVFPLLMKISVSKKVRIAP